MRLWRPSYQLGFARNAGEAMFPQLWQGKVAHWVMALGNTGDTVFDLMRKHDMALTNMDKATDWEVSDLNLGYVLDFDGSDDELNVSSLAGMPTGGPMAVRAIFRPTAGDGGRIASHTNASVSRGWYLTFNAVENTTFTTLGVKDYNASVNVIGGDWNYLGISLDANHDVDFFGRNLETGAIETQLVTHTAGMIAPVSGDLVKIGNSARFPSRGVMKIAEVVVYERTCTYNEHLLYATYPYIDLVPRQYPGPLDTGAVAAARRIFVVS